MIFPAIGFKVTRIGGKDTPMSQRLSQNHQRSIGQIHRQICIFLHQLDHTQKLLWIKLITQKQAVMIRSQKLTHLPQTQPALQ